MKDTAEQSNEVETASQQIEYLPTADLIPYASNSRTHSDEQVAQIAASIREFGWTNPVLIDEQNNIIAGHGRVMALMRFPKGSKYRSGITEYDVSIVPCLRLSHLTDSQKRQYVIADNKLALNAGWNQELLNAELLGLSSDGFDLSLIGFDDDELAAALGAVEEPELKQLHIQPPPKMTWVLIGIPTVRFGEINEAIESIAKLENTIVETTSNDG